MTIHAIADLHLDTGNKPMDVFGEQWVNHAERIFSRWREQVREEDVVLMPGDISWAMRLDEAREHLERIGALPGIKLLIRGNHDYWWSSVSRVRAALPPRMFALQNDGMLIRGTLFAGTRGWLLPGEGAGAEDEKIYRRELIRLEISLKSARKFSGNAPLVGMMHFPPLTHEQTDTGFTRLFRHYGVRRVVYGHLHGAALRGAFRGESEGVLYDQVSSDGLDFSLKRIG